MNKIKNVGNAMISVGNKILLKGKKHSPVIFLIGGGIAAVGGIIFTVKGTLALEKILDEHKNTIERIHTAEEDEKFSELYTEDLVKKDITSTYVKTGVKVAKTYLPAFTFFALSTTSILFSYKILNGRNVAITSALAGATTSFNAYRDKVKERYGEDIDNEFLNGLNKITISEETTDESGNKVTVEKIVEELDPTVNKDCLFIFDERSSKWYEDHGNSDINLCTLETIERYWNSKYQTGSPIFLNDVLDDLGLEKTKAGQIGGWLKNGKDLEGDGFIDFGIKEIYIPIEELSEFDDLPFDESHKKAYMLNFNCDGNIYELM